MNTEDSSTMETLRAAPYAHRVATGPVSETAERFLRAIVEHIPVREIEELHLFSPIRQGVLETGIAVIATRGADGSERHGVHTARYTYVIKGPDRGRWETGVVEEARAPLVKVEEVVRGVQRRAGEESPIAVYGADDLLRVLRLEAPADGS